MRPVAQTDFRAPADWRPPVEGAPVVWRMRLLAVAVGLVIVTSADRAWAGCGEYVLIEGQMPMVEHPNVPDAPRCPNGECRRGESKPLVPIVPVTFHSGDHWATLPGSSDHSPQDRHCWMAASDVSCDSVSLTPRERPPRCA